MVPRYCPSCFARHQEKFLLCFPCRDELHDLQLHVQDGIRSCFRYRGVVRRLVLRAKVQGDHRAVTLLSDLVIDHPLVVDWLQDLDFLMPSPSSLWGRARGRLDLAALLVTAISKRHGLTVRTAPSELFWRFRKRALVHRVAREPLLTDPSTCYPGTGDGPRIGLFDDVVTTGQTLAWTRAALPPDASVRPLTLASARDILR